MSDISFGLEFRNMVRSLRIRSLRNPRTNPIITGFVNGLAQMGSAGTVGSTVNFPKTRSGEAFRGDWNRVGGDLKRSFEKVRSREKTKA
jgi:hypothetical protein